MTNTFEDTEGLTELGPEAVEAIQTAIAPMPCPACDRITSVTVQRGYECPGGLLIVDLAVTCEACGYSEQ